jgi:SSS family solute:Na+ symporter
MQFFIIVLYLLITLGIGYFSRKGSGAAPAEFFLAGRRLSPLLLFFTMAASNFSAFTIFGLSGAGYRMGYAFYPVMGYATGFMALSFVLIGGKILKLSRSRGYITPGDFIADRYGSPGLKILFSAVLVVFTLPYIAIQTIAAGKSLHSMTGIPYLAGAVLVTLFIALYVGMGGMRAIAWTDLVQGLMMIGFTTVAFYLITAGSGGFRQIHQSLLQDNPGHLSRPGSGGILTPGVWFGYFVLWFFADPMFPHLFQRFMAARDEKALQRTVILYPLITTLLFFLTVSIGVIGRAVIPGLADSQSDAIFPLLLARFTGPLLGGILLTGTLAALMSTLDSQLLTVASIISLEVPVKRLKSPAARRGVVVLLSLLGLLIALRPPETLLDFINRTTFNGLAVLAPTVIGGLYWGGGNRFGATASILTGELLVLLFYFDILTAPGTLTVVPVITAACLVYVLTSLVSNDRAGNSSIVFPLHPRWRTWTAVFLMLLFLGQDFWNWNRSPRLFLGLPGWVWYFIFLGLFLSGVFACMFRMGNREFRRQVGLEIILYKEDSRP